MKTDEKYPIPVPLHSKVVAQAALAAVLMIAGIAIAILFAPAGAFPLLFLSVLAAANSVHIYRAAVRGRCIELHGTMLKVEQTAFLRRPKAILAEVDGKALHITLRNRLHIPDEGDHVLIYVLDDTPIYDWKGLKQLSSYLTLVCDDGVEPR